MRAGSWSLVFVSAAAVVAAIGCSAADGGLIADPIVDDDAAATGEETGSTPDEDTGSVTPGDDTGTPTPKPDTGKPTVADTAVTDTYKPDTYKPPVDTGTVILDVGTPGDWPTASAALEQGILEETNKRRAAGASCGTKGTFPPVGPLVMHPLLQKAARLHSKDMGDKNYFSHDNLAGQSPFDRMKAQGYKGGYMGENIAAGNSTVAKTMDQWMKSDGHCANIMSKNYTQLGVGYYYAPSSTYKHYWTQNFGAGG